MPNAGSPSCSAATSGSRRPDASSSRSSVVDSPPGSTSAVEPLELRGRAHLDGLGAEAAERGDVLAERRPAGRARRPSRRYQPRVGEELLAGAYSIVEAEHRLAEALRRPRRATLGVLVVRRRLDDRARRGAPGRSDLKMPEPTNTPSAPSCIISAASAGVAMPPAAKLTTGSRPCSATSRTSSNGAPQLLGRGVQLVVVQGLEPADLAGDRAHVAHGLDDVAGAGLALGADHRRALADAAQRLAEVAWRRRRTGP